MRKVAVGIGMLMVGGLSAFAGEFPYTTNLNQRYYTNETTLASYELVDVPKVGQGMLDGENVAVITMANAVMTALDEDGWTECTNALTDIQAAFTLKSMSDDTDVCEWMGYTGGAWQEFTGVEAKAGTYTIKIEIDYSLTNPKVRYTVGSTVMHLTPDDDGWVGLGKSADKVENVQLCGYGTTGEVKGEAAARPAEGTVTVVEDVSSNYKSIRLGIAATGVWGVNNVNVVVKDSAGDAVGTVNQALSKAVDGTNYVDLASYLKPGETYTYEVKLTDGGSHEAGKTVSQPVNLFSSDAWFYFNKSDAFVNATSTGLTIADSKFFATDEEVEGLVMPTSDPKANLGTVVTTEIEVSNVCTELTDFTGDDKPQFAVALGGTSNARKWMYCEDGIWEESAATDIPTENGTYEGRATFDYAKHCVKYEIRPQNGVYKTLVESAALPYADTRLNKVGILGGGNVSGLVAELKLAEPPPVSDDDITPPGTGTDGKIKLHNNTEVGLDKLDAGSYVLESDSGKNCHLKWKDVSGKIGKVVNGKLQVKAANILNGVSSSYDSYVLGLDAEVATDRPAAIVKPGASQMVDNKPVVPVYVPNLKQTKAVELGYTIKLVLEQKNGAAWEPVAGGTQEINPTTGETVSGNDIKIPLDGEIYRVNTVIE